jgi:hypothetical protein
MTKPILFSTPMVQAILAERKTQTRRVMTPQPPYNFCHRQGDSWFWTERDADDDMMRWWPSYDVGLIPPYLPGDILWVRETWCGNTKSGYMYCADCPENGPSGMCVECRRPSIHMPREAARIFLRVTDARAERVQEIDRHDVLAEGIPDCSEGLCVGPCTINCGSSQSVIKQYAELWNALYAKRGHGWDKNDWVWAITFERCEKPEEVTA